MTAKHVIGLIAGSGDFPREIAEAIVASGQSVFILGLRGFAERGLRRFPHAFVDMLDPEQAIRILKQHAVRDIVLAGGVNRPGPAALFSIYSAYRHRDELRKLFNRGDDHVLRGVTAFLEDNGFRILGVDAVAPSVLAPSGAIGSIAMPDDCVASVERALSLLSDLGRYDVGQGVVMAGERILAIEGPEGTDAMLQRVHDMQRAKRVKLGHDSAILVKMAKPEQDRRVDLPAIGPKTIRSAMRAGLAGLVVAAHEVVLVERRKLQAEADQAGLFVVGVEVQGARRK